MSPADTSMPSLSVVIPVINQPTWIGPTIEDVTVAIERSGFEDAEIVVVVADEKTREVLMKLQPRIPMHVLDEEHPGRLAARQQGVEAASGELVLLLDSRISIVPDALRFVSDRITDEDRLPIWTSHFEFNVSTPYGRFWSVIIPLLWRSYYSQPRTTSFGIEEYDRFAKSTTCFLAPRSMLLGANTEFSSYYADSHSASDDTGLIRLLAARQRINVSPHFACIYTPHESYSAFMHNIHHRGKTFLDSYGRRGTRFFPIVLAFYPISLLTAILALRRPRLAVRALAASPLPFAAATIASRRSLADVFAVSWVGPSWLAAMSVGLWTGLGKALRARVANQIGQHEELRQAETVPGEPVASTG